VKFVIEEQNSKKNDQNIKKKNEEIICQSKICIKDHLSLKFYFVYFLVFRLEKERESCWWLKWTILVLMIYIYSNSFFFIKLKTYDKKNVFLKKYIY